MSGLFDLEHFISGVGRAMSLRQALRLCASMKRDDFVSPHPLFDYDFYRTHAAPLAPHENPLVSFLTKPRRRYEQPCELFDARYYLESYPDLAARRVNALSHFVQVGGPERRNPHLLFDTDWYVRTNPEMVSLGVNPLVHFLKAGASELRDPHPLFDSRWYIEQRPPGLTSGANALLHYLRTGHETLLSPHPLFDARFYVAEYPEVSGKNPLMDYLAGGALSGRNPNPNFDSTWYLDEYQDVRVLKLNPLSHYVTSGAREGRKSHGGDRPENKWTRFHLDIAPRTRTRPLPGINFVGPVTIVGGLGKSARGYVEAIRSAGVACSVHAWTGGYERLARVAFEARPGPRYNVNLVHLNLDFLANAGLMEASILAALMSPDRYSVAIVYWELSSITQDQIAPLRAFDEVWCASSFVCNTLRGAGVERLRIVRPALTESIVLQEPAERRPGQRYTFLYSCDVGHGPLRKNVETLVRAFAEEFAEDEGAACIIKLINASPDYVSKLRELFAPRLDLQLIDKTIGEEEMRQLFAGCDCYVSPHRSEGLGLTILEAMALGKPVICTPYGGVADFVSSDNAFLVEYDLEQVGEGDPMYPPDALWANPRMDSLRAAMRRSFEQRELAESLGRKARATFRDLFSASRTGAVLLDEFTRIQRSKGYLASVSGEGAQSTRDL